MAKLTLEANPTFTADVGVPVAGAPDVLVPFNFKHRARTELLQWLKELDGKDKVTAITDCVTAWGFEDEFTPANVGRLLEQRIGSGDAIVNTYTEELIKARTKN